MKNSNQKMPVDSLGKMIKEARIKFGLTKEELVLKINNSKLNVSILDSWEKGKDFPDLDMIYELCYALNLNPNELLEIKNLIQRERRHEPNWKLRSVVSGLLEFAKPGYQFASFLSKIVLALILVILYKYIHIAYEASDNPVVIETEEIIGEYMNVENNINNEEIKNET